MGIYFTTVLTFMGFVVAEGGCAYTRGFFWPSQVMARFGRNGIAFATHEGMWGDLLVLPFVFAHVVEKYHAQWSTVAISWAVLGGMVLTAANQAMCNMSPVPDPLGFQKEKFSSTILLHFIYMSAGSAVLGLYVFATNGQPALEVVLVSVIVGIHLMCGVHVPMGIITRFARFDWCPDFLSSPMLPILLAFIWGAATIGSFIAACFQAAPFVLLVGIALVGATWATTFIAPAPLQRHS